MYYNTSVKSTGCCYRTSRDPNGREPRTGGVLDALNFQRAQRASLSEIVPLAEKIPYDPREGKSLRDSEKLWEVSLHVFAHESVDLL